MDHDKLIRMSQVISRLKSQSLLMSYDSRSWLCVCIPLVPVLLSSGGCLPFQLVKQLTKRRYNQLLCRNRYVAIVWIPLVPALLSSGGEEVSLQLSSGQPVFFSMQIYCSFYKITSIPSFHSNLSLFFDCFFSYFKLKQSVAVLSSSNCLTVRKSQASCFRLKNNIVTNSQVALISQTHWFTTVPFIFSSKILSLQGVECSRVDPEEKQVDDLGQW